MVENIGLNDVVFYSFRDAKVIDTPSDITLTRGGTVGPPSIAFGGIGVEVAKAVDKASFDDGVETGSLFVSKARVLSISLRIGEINFGVSDVKVTAKNNRFYFL